MAISKDKEEVIRKKMRQLGINEDDLIEKFILGSGKGGQKIQKTNSCVYLKHIPTGIEIKCQKDRFRETNRWVARRDLCEKIETMILKIKTDKQMEREKVRRQKKRRTRKQKEKILQEKKIHSEKNK